MHSQESHVQIGLAGTGRMGCAIARRILAAGFDLTVWNRSVDKCELLRAQGANVASSPSALASECSLVLTLVSGEQSNLALYEGEGGLFSARTTTSFFNLSTLSPQVVRRLHTGAAASGHAFIDAPVLGTVAPAERGELVILAGGDAAAIALATPLLQCFSRKIVTTGEVGTGTAMKLVHNTVLTLYWHAVGEAMGYGAASGLQTEDMVAVIGDSFAAIRQWPLKVPVLLEQTASAGFDLRGLEAEIAASEQLFDQAGVSHDMLSLARGTVDAAISKGWGDRDVAALALFGRDMAHLRTVKE